MVDDFSKFIMPVVVFATASFLWVPQDYWTAHWWNRWAYSMMAIAVGLAFQFRKLHWSLIAPIAISMVSALYPLVQIIMRFGWIGTVFTGVPNAYQMSFVAQSCFTALSFIMVTTYAMNADCDELETLANCFGMFCLLSSFCVIAETLHGPYAMKEDPQYLGRLYMFRGGYIGNPSMNACLIAVTLPFFFKLNIWTPWKIIPFVAIICSHASQPVGIAAVMLAAYFFCKSEWRLKHTILVALSLWGLIISLGVFFHGKDLFHDSGRLYMYELAWAHWWQAALTVKLFGFGNGTLAIYFPQWQNTLRMTDPATNFDWFFWIHSDWLQTLIDQGVVGLVAYLNLFGFVMVSAYRKSAELFSCIAGFGAMALFNFPVHLPAHAIVGAVLVVMVFRKEYRW